MNRMVLAVLAGSVAVAACSSDAAPGETSPIVGTWRQTGSEERIGTAQWSIAKDADCRTDNTEEYASGGDWTLYDGTIPCGSDGAKIIKGTWRMAAANTKVIYTYAGASNEYVSTVESLSATDMVLTFDTGLTSGKQSRNTYRKQ